MGNFKVGDKVVIIDDEITNFIGWTGVIVKERKNTFAVIMHKALLLPDPNNDLLMNTRDLFPHEIELDKTQVVLDIIKDL